MTHQLDPKSLNVWDYKPWWCQPWSIVLTAVTLIGGSWLLLRLWWLTVLVAIPVLTWMVFFVLIYPKLITQSGVLLDEKASE
ncbi:MAG: hypothetical protein HC840_17175 [Leptolyngbyaceae cyanobacterium RM2_2_4]|nr:hypothetical protein [Leptolyngbyaceae cyanobacterium SM1_4_3]NJN92134.1 hypothetical protein [Leptolyngbyaceae cyanobacterium SL_5_14]NJO50884.1 hypothetical protein [Leptolyngbyaceae cyanobacterium RM2_2_4]